MRRDSFKSDVLEGFKLPQPRSNDAVDWCALIGAERGRPISVRHRSASQISAVVGLPPGAEPGPCGILLRTHGGDFIAVDKQAPAFLQQHTVLHELAHLLWGHEGSASTDEEEFQAEKTADLLAAVVSHRRPGLVAKLLGRGLSGPFFWRSGKGAVSESPRNG